MITIYLGIVLPLLLREKKEYKAACITDCTSGWIEYFST